MASSPTVNDDAAPLMPSAAPGAAPPIGREAALRVAVLDNDSGFVQVLSKRMERLGHELRVLNGPVPVEAIRAMRLSGLVVDLTIFGVHAWEWLERLTGSSPDLGIVVCTSASTVAQRVRGLRLGADDWVGKPAHPEEVIARVESVVRRRRRAAEKLQGKPVAAGEVEIRPDRFQGFANGASLDLTRREFELLQLLAAAEGRVLEREEIYSRLWGYAMVRGDRSVDVFVRKLRQKLEKASPRWRYIHTHFGIGYRFAAEPEAGTDPHRDGELSASRSAARGRSGSAVGEDRSSGSDVGGDAIGEQSELARPEQQDELARSAA